MPYLDTINEKRRQKSEKIQAEYTATKLAAVLKEHLKSYKPESDERVLQSLAAIERACSKDDSQMLALLSEVRDAVNGEAPPVIVPAPTVEVLQKNLDTSNIEELLKDVIAKLSVEQTPQEASSPTVEQPEPLTHYTAQDLDNAPDGTQYIGFMSMSGGWYIMHHDPKSDRNRYFFGEGEYADAWDFRVSHEYKILSEAR